MSNLKRGSRSKKERLHKIIAHAGVCSLRKAERLIADGMVSVNGSVVTQTGASANPAKDKIEVEGELIVTHKLPYIYIKCYKPKECITTKSDDKGRKTVLDLLPAEYKSLNPVGRLDY